jgi:hypothetical protein
VALLFWNACAHCLPYSRSQSPLHYALAETDVDASVQFAICAALLESCPQLMILHKPAQDLPINFALCWGASLAMLELLLKYEMRLNPSDADFVAVRRCAQFDYMQV